MLRKLVDVVPRGMVIPMLILDFIVKIKNRLAFHEFFNFIIRFAGSLLWITSLELDREKGCLARLVVALDQDFLINAFQYGDIDLRKQRLVLYSVKTIF